jgi:hypothetical protein
MSKYFRLVEIAVGVVFFIYWAIVDTPFSTNNNHVLHGVSICLAVALFVLLLWQGMERSPTEWLGDARPISLSVQELRVNIYDVLESYGSPASKYFSDVLFRLPQYLVRVDERLSPAPRGAEVQATLTFRLSREALQARAKSGHNRDTALGLVRSQKRRFVSKAVAVSETSHHPLLVPVFRCKRGERIDELVVIDNTTGQHAARLSRRESTGLAAHALRERIFFHAEELHVSPPNVDQMDQFLVDILTGKEAEANVEERLKKLLCIENADLGDLASLCKYLLGNYLIVAELVWPHANKVVARVEHFVGDVTPASTTFEKMRKRFGLAPSIVELPMTYALQAQIYHFQLAAPPDQYVYDHRLEHLNSGLLIDQNELATYNEPYVRVYGKDGKTNAHCYMRTRNSARPPVPPDVKSVVALKEIPPGALGAATIIAIALAGLIVFFTITRIAINGPVPTIDTSSLFNSDIPAVLLALPAFTALLLGHWADQARLPRSSLSAYWGLLGTMLLSFVSALLFILDANRIFKTRLLVTVWSTGLKPDGSRQGPYFTTDWVWLLLSAMAVTHALYLIARLRGELKYYLSLPEQIKVDRPLGYVEVESQGTQQPSAAAT